MSPDLILPALFLLALVAIVALVWLASREQDIRTPRNSYYGKTNAQSRYRQALQVNESWRQPIIGSVLGLLMLGVTRALDNPSALAIMAMVFLALLAWEVSEHRKSTGRNPSPPSLPPARPSQPSTPAQPVKSPTPNTFTPPPRLTATPGQRVPSDSTVQRLLTLTHGDRKLAGRLIQSVMDRFPDKSEAWCYEKVVYDLERDRQRG